MSTSRLVLIVVFDGVQMLDAVGPAEVFASATRHVSAGGYQLRIVSPDGRTVRADPGLRLDVDSGLDSLPKSIDTLIVAGGQGAPKIAASAEILAAIHELGQRSRRICSVCTGALVLAATGFLTGKTVTTHWSAGYQLAHQFPEVHVDPDRIFVRDGNVYTSGGVSAGMDLAPELVESDHDATIARVVARELVLFLKRPGGQSQFSDRFAHNVAAKSPIRAVIDMVVAEPSADHHVSNMAARAQVSERHLARLFRLHTDTTPALFVERVRVAVARDHLEQTNLNLESIAQRSGFNTTETLRRAFIRVTGVSPSDYRQRFSTTSDLPPIQNGILECRSR